MRITFIPLTQLILKAVSLSIDLDYILKKQVPKVKRLHSKKTVYLLYVPKVKASRICFYVYYKAMTINNMLFILFHYAFFILINAQFSK